MVTKRSVSVSSACVYDAVVTRIVDNQQVVSNELIDLLAIDKMDFDKIIINEDVALGSGKKRPLPDFSNVEINGEFDCSNFYISDTSVLPSGITALKCYYSINNLEVLKNILPSTVKTVYVRNAVINSVQKDADNLQIAKDFMAAFPTVDVVGKNETLILREIIAKKETVKTKTKTIETVKITSEETNDRSGKREGFLSILEVANSFKEMDAFNGLNVKEIKKQIKNFLHSDSQNALWGNVQNYVREDAVPYLVEALLKPEQESEDKQEYAVKVPVEVTEKKSKIVEDETTKKNSPNELKPVKIKKFFDKRVWGSVCKSVKGNKTLLLKFLNDINAVNLNPLQKDVRVGAGRIACVKNKELKHVPNLELKNACYIAQSFGRDNNRPRIIWCILSSGELVAADFFANHGDGKNKCAYNSAIQSNVLRDKTEQNIIKTPQDYIDVKSLLKEIEEQVKEKEQKENADEKCETLKPNVVPEEIVVAPQQIPLSEKTSEQIIICNELSSDVEKAPDELKVEKPKRPRIRRVIKEKSQKENKKNEILKPTAVPEEFVVDKPPVTSSEKTTGTAEAEKVIEQFDEVPEFKKEPVFQVSYELEDVFNIISEDIMKLKKALLSETDTDRSLALATSLAEKLKDKQMLESNIDIAKRTFDILKRYVINLNDRNR